MRKLSVVVISFFCFNFIHSFAFASSRGEVDLVERMGLVVLHLGIILFAAWLGSVLFERMKLPAVLGEVVAGVAIGPFLLGGIPLPGFPAGIFPNMGGALPVYSELYGFTVIASIILLFLVGLETDIETFLSYSVAGTAVGFGGAIVSFVAGDLVAVWFSKAIFGTPFGFGHPVALFMGIVSTATSVGITARILSERRKMGSPEGVTILSAAVIDDVLGIIILAVVIGIAKSGHVEWRQVAYISAKAVGIWVGFTAMGLFVAHRLAKFLKTFKDRTTIAVMSLAIALLVAGIFERSGLAMIIGAYIMGLSLSKTDLSFIIQDKLSVLYRFFMPVFFCVMGMFIDVRELISPRLMGFWMTFVVLAVSSKIIGCALPAAVFNFNVRGALRVGMGMVPRGEVALIIAGIGLSSGIISRDVFSVAVVMSFLTTLITPPILDKMLSSDKKVLRKEPKNKIEHEIIKYTMPNPETQELLLTRVISDFESEGFYVHCLQISGSSVYQIRKDQTFITLNASAEELVFDCLKEDAAFVHTLFYEVLAEFESLMKNIKALEDSAKIGKKIFECSNGNGSKKASTVKLQEVISPLAVEVDLKGSSKHEVIESLTDLLTRSGQINTLKRETVLNDILEREVDMSTGMQYGVAFPHAKTKAVDRLISAVGILKNGVDFDSLDKQPTKIFVVTLAPKDASQCYLKYISEMSTFLMDEANREMLLKCRHNVELYRKITEYSSVKQ